MPIVTVTTSDTPNTGRDKLNANDAFLTAETKTKIAAHTIENADANNILLCSETFNLTLPSGLEDDLIVMVLATSGIVSVVPGSGATLEGGAFDLDATNDLAVATLVHTTGGQWYALSARTGAPKPQVVTPSVSLTLDETYDGAIVEVADGTTITTGSGIPAGWSCTLVRVGALSATIARGTGHALYGPGGNLASFTINSQWEAAALYARGGDAFVLVGPVT